MVKVGVGAGRAEGALKGADPRVQIIRRQVTIAPFAVRAEFKHGSYPVGLVAFFYYARE